MIIWSVVALLTKRTGLSKETRKKSAPIHKVWTVSLKNYGVFLFCFCFVIPEVIERNVHREAEQGPWRLQDIGEKRAPLPLRTLGAPRMTGPGSMVT